MKVVLLILGIIVGLLILITIVGAFMSRTHVATSEITLKQPIDSVYKVLRDVGGMTTWWKDLKTSERVAGASGERWRQVAGGFTMELDIVNDDPPRGFVSNIVEQPGAPFGGRWVYTLTTVQGGTRVSVSEEGWIGPPPFRVMASIMGLNRTLDSVLISLGTHFGEQVRPEHK